MNSPHIASTSESTVVSEKVEYFESEIGERLIANTSHEVLSTARSVRILQSQDSNQVWLNEVKMKLGFRRRVKLGGIIVWCLIVNYLCNT